MEIWTIKFHKIKKNDFLKSCSTQKACTQMLNTPFRINKNSETQHDQPLSYTVLVHLFKGGNSR